MTTTKFYLLFLFICTLNNVMAEMALSMQKKKTCKVNNKKGEVQEVKIGKKQETPLKTCKAKCLKAEAAACAYDDVSRLCSIILSGYKGAEDATGKDKGKKYCGKLIEVEAEEEEEGIPEEEEEEEVEEKKCTLKAKLGFPYDDPDEAGYYGYHADMLDVTEVGDNWYVCSWYYTKHLPEWCTYENSDPKGDSAYVVNLDDYYKDMETITEETIKVFNAASKSFVFKVEHYYFKEDYYTTYDNWEDHMNAATLWIDVTTGDFKGPLKRNGWQHPTDIDVATHKQKNNGDWKVNPDYEGVFTVTVDCNKNCKCTATYELP